LPAEKCQNGAWFKMLAVDHLRRAVTLRAQGNGEGAREEFAQCARIAVKPTVWTPELLDPPDVNAECIKVASATQP
jgi:hypothetical protein